jgi:hypothetical protein
LKSPKNSFFCFIFWSVVVLCFFLKKTTLMSVERTANQPRVVEPDILLPV